MSKDNTRKEVVIDSHKEYSCPWFSIYKEKIRYPSGAVGDYYILRRPTYFISIIALTQDKIVILRQWRATLKDWIWEVPMGSIEKDEDMQKAAEREFLEETGYKANSWEYLGDFAVAPGNSDQRGKVFLAKKLVKVTGKAENNPKEIIEVNLVKIEEFEKMIAQGKFNDGPSLASYLIYKSKYTNIKI